MASNKTDTERLFEHFPLQPRAPIRAIAFGGGGPAVGNSIGFLLALEAWNQKAEDEDRGRRRVDFPVWVAGCVGAWLTCLYHMSDARQGKTKAQATAEWIGEFFRDNDEYAMFPAPTTFTPDLPEMIRGALSFMSDPRTYQGLVVPNSVARAYRDVVDYYLHPERWNPGDFCLLMLNSVFAPSPASRFLMGLLYRTPIPGLNRLWFDERYSLLKKVTDGLVKIRGKDYPDIYVNAYNIADHESQMFSNHTRINPEKIKPLDSAALCATSALPYVLSPIEIDGKLHIEGALVDSFCFEAVRYLDKLSPHAKSGAGTEINEVWISQIVHHKQVQAPQNLLDALNNLIMLYAGTTSRYDIQCFINDHNHGEYARFMLDKLDELAPAGSAGAKRAKAKAPAKPADRKPPPDPIEYLRLPIQAKTTHYWSQQNLKDSIEASRDECYEYIERYGKSLTDKGWRTPDPEQIFVSQEEPTKLCD